MKSTLVIIAGLALATLSCQPQKDPLLEPGIPWKMAEYRHEEVADVRYELSFDIPAEKSRPIPARLHLSLTINDLEHPLFLDFNAPDSLLQKLTVNGKEAVIDHRLEHLIIEQKLLVIGNNSIDIVFHAGEQSLNRNEEYLYTLLVPDRASTLFPCFDQPNLKATYRLQITAPEDWLVLAGAPAEKIDTLTEKRKFFFGETDPMSTYLFSFVAGKFKSATSTRSDREMTLLYRETNETKIRMSLPAIFDLHDQAIHFLEEYTAHTFPFQKLDFASIPGFQYGGMEHIGAIQYNESAMFLDSSATETQLMSRAKVIAHETAHMWFGDMVTMNWFDDVWMKEVFANFMADKIINPSFPKINHSLSFFTTHYPAAYAEDRTKGTNAIRQPLKNLKDAGSLYGNIIYSKAPIVMRQLETAVGATAFRAGIREYMKTFAYGNATWPDLVDLIDQQSPVDVAKWSEVWVNQSGRPLLDADIRFAGDQIEYLAISQHAEDGSDKLWPQTFNVALIYDDSLKYLPVTISESQVIIPQAQGLPRPKAMLYNANGYGYGVFPVDTSSLSMIPSLTDEVARASAYVNLYENILSGSTSASKGMKSYLKALSQEPNELILSQITSKISSIFWHYLSPEERTQLQPALEEMLYTELQKMHTPNTKKVLFGLYSGIAYTETGRDTLYKLWSKEQVIQDLRLNDDDFTSLAMTLALYGHEQSAEILSQARASLTNPDKIARFDYLQPALSADDAVRDQFFESFSKAENREKESWVLDACYYIHHPLHQQQALKHVPLCLNLLQEIQLTGDIFFPKRWLMATVGQYQSDQALEEVEKFLKGQPDYNPILKSKLLQATDNLYRYNELVRKP